MLSEYGESITASAAVSSGRGQARASARRISARRGERSREIARRPRVRATSPIVPEPAIGSTTSSPGRLYRRTRFSAHRAGVTPLNEASPAPGWPSDWLEKSQHVYASRSVRPSMAHASGSRDGCAGDEERATTSTYVPHPYEPGFRREMRESENLPRGEWMCARAGGPPRRSDTGDAGLGGGGPRRRCRTEGRPEGPRRRFARIRTRR